MRRRLLATLAAMLLLAGGLVGCGIPNETGVHVVGAGPARGDGTDSGPRAAPPGRLDSGDDVEEFVANFLTAAAGEIGGAYERVKEYIAPTRQGDLPEERGDDMGINIVRLTEPISINHQQDGTSLVTIKVQHVGVLRSNGAVEPPELSDTSYTFVVGRLPARLDDATSDDVLGAAKLQKAAEYSGLYVLRPPPALLMREEALRDYYEPRTIYFWSKDRSALVPDLRHLPLAVPQSRRADEVVGWLVRGPADWLADAVHPLPAGTQKLSNVTHSDGRLVVNLSIGPAADQALVLSQLITQLAWSLGYDHAGLLEVKIKDESREIVDITERRRDNPVYRIDEHQQRYAVYGGRIHALRNPADTAPDVLVSASVNRDVVSASIVRINDNVVAAAVVVDAGGGRRLSVGHGMNVVDRVESSEIHVEMGRPVWLRSTLSAVNPRGLVVADGRLYEFGLYSRPDLTPVDLPGDPKRVSAVAAALDGYRIAYVADGSLYVAGLTLSDGAVRVHTPRLLSTRLGDLTAVEWVGENRLVVAGVADDNQVALHDIGDDGALYSPRVSQRGTAKITHLATYPENPVRAGGNRVMYEVNGVAWDAFIGRIGVADLEDLSDDPPESETPTAPFFVY